MRSVLFLTIFLFSFSCQQSFAQKPFSISLFPGYHIGNSNDVISFGTASKITYIFGSTISTRSNFMGFPMEVSLGYSWGNSIVRPYNTKPGGYYIPYKFDFWYQTIPVEALYIHPLNDNVELMGGLNISGQYRKLFLQDGTSMNNEHLFNFGIGLTGKIQSVLKKFQNGKGAIFGNLTARWTEYFIHNSRGRNVDDFTIRHVTLAPQIGVSWNLAQQASHN
jgi:hypothetical protein